MWCSAVGGFVTLILSLLVASIAAGAQQATKVHRIGWLSTDFPPPASTSQAREEAFRQGLRALGYVEGQNLVLAFRYAQGSAERLPDLAAELVRLPVEVLVAGGGPAIRAAQHATRTIPIVMAGTGDPVARGFIASLARPGGNITGLSLLMAELPGKRLELLKETVPQSTRIAVLENPANPGHKPQLHNLAVTARTLELHLHVVEVRNADELDPAFAAMTQTGVDALIVFGDTLLLDSLRGRTIDLAARHHLPAMYDWREIVVAGGLMSYGPSLSDMHRRAAVYVDKLLQGAKPADLPVEQPTKFELVINLKTAQAIGLTMPPTLLFQADEVLK
jgi:putative tryptophan/tyrosine transport system substrate-binding protein